ncbi:Serine/threonine-protein kinase [Rhizoctonia solani]|uniref:non-specific serine/threonine protein kinase n=1 Tax=Rhizoctonia solani TaxID=456999 RepID=A0A8H8P1X4_9AGAM|nr:Serine/threonine-protein kinase [Rhizoctonia solani]QRW22822.1 Serine/threonine-protein kinase [Rhizoctonia solani]
MSTTAALLDSAQLIAQGAEARVYKTTLGSSPVLLKHRFPKQYRNSALDVSLTKQRVSGEARALLRCLRFGVSVPGIRFVHADTGVLGIEWIEGTSVRKVLGGGAEGEEELDVAEEEIEDEEAEMDELKDVYGLTQEGLMTLIGEEIAKMHKSDIIHGDLTTSNMMLRQDTKNKETQLVLIDFGLSYNSVLVEDKAVDLYVLERAFASTHPQSEGMFSQVLEAYGRVSGPAWKNIKRRLDDEVFMYQIISRSFQQVCSQWMKVALANHALWTHIHIVEHFDDDNVALWVSRAGPDALFDIEIDMLEPYCGVAFFDITDWQEQVSHIGRIFKFFSSVKAGPQRWRSLSLSVLQPEPMYKFIQLLNKHPAPNLSHLYLCSEPDRSDDEFHKERCLTDAHYCKGYSPSEHAVPNLRHAEFTYVSWRYIFDRPKPLLSGLVKLKLSAGTVIPELVLPNIQILLLANPNLRWLRINAEFAYDYEFDRLPDEKCPKPVLLSSLKFLSLEGGDNISLVSDILSIITAPSLDGLMLGSHGVSNDDEFVSKIFNYLATGQPPMTENSAIASINKSAFRFSANWILQAYP